MISMLYFREHPVYNVLHKNKSFDYVRDIMGIYDNKTCVEAGYTWENSIINFDNVGSAYLALFQVVSAFSPLYAFNIYHSYPIETFFLKRYSCLRFFSVFGSFGVVLGKV